jgi:hypothetical protein
VKAELFAPCLWDQVSLCVCLCIPFIVARQRLGNNPPVVARQRLGRNVTVVTNAHAKIEEILYTSFSMWPVSYQGKKAISSSQNLSSSGQSPYEKRWAQVSRVRSWFCPWPALRWMFTNAIAYPRGRSSISRLRTKQFSGTQRCLGSKEIMFYVDRYSSHQTCLTPSKMCSVWAMYGSKLSSWAQNVFRLYSSVVSMRAVAVMACFKLYPSIFVEQVRNTTKIYYLALNSSSKCCI